MEKNTVCIGVEEYLEMRDFIENIKNGKIYTIFHSGYSSVSVEFREKSEALAIAEAYNKDIRRVLDKSKADFDERLEAMETKHHNRMGEIAKMSIWEFRKWKKSRE